MNKRTPIKNHIQEIQLVNTRSLAILMFMIVIVLLLIFRLSYLQLSKHTLYNMLSKKNSVDLIPIEPPRGLIYDRNGILLAENVPVFSLDVVPYKINNVKESLAQVSRIILLTDTDIAQFHKQLKQRRRFDEIPLKLKLTEAEVARFAENSYKLPGFLIKARLIRHYPFEASFSHTLGYVGRINVEELTDINQSNYSATNYIGKLGIEKFYESDLHGTVGYQRVENDASGEPIRILNQIAPVSGKDLYLTLDSKLQTATEKALNGLRGAAVVINPKNGEVLAMVSQPSYDPNSFVSGISTEDFQALQNSAERPLYNRAIRGLYPLASTIKPFIALEGLNEGIITPSYSLFDPGWYRIKNTEHPFHDWRHHGHGIVNLNKAIFTSCDTYFYDLAAKLGIDKMDRILSEFGFGAATKIDVQEELSGVIASPQWKRRMKGQPWYTGDTIISGIGQGYMQATPLQLAVGTATLASHGIRYQPHLLMKYANPTRIGNAPFLPPPYKIQLNDASYWDTIIADMKNVITSPFGTGYKHFGPAPYSIAAKTGTAQVFTKKRNETDEDIHDQEKLPEKLRDHSLFVAFAPIEDPQIAVAVVIENSKLASTVARKIMDYYLIKNPNEKNPIFNNAKIHAYINKDKHGTGIQTQEQIQN